MNPKQREEKTFSDSCPNKTLQAAFFLFYFSFFVLKSEHTA